VVNGGVAPAPFLSMTQFFGSGGLCSTVGDLARWQRLLAGGKVVSAHSYELMTTPDTLNDGSRLTYGFGLSPGELDGHAVVSHGGGLPGFTTVGMFFPAETLSVVVFTNAGAGPGPLGVNIARIALGLPLPATNATATQLSASDRDLIIGVYEFERSNGGSLVMHVALENGQLTAQTEGAGREKVALIHTDDLIFGAASDPSLRLVFGRHGAVTLMERGVVLKGRKR
jgi:CubicO group peptidase (beta-lactamase class C family)